MGRQLRFYLLPDDVDSLLYNLKESVGIRLFLGKTPTAELVEVNSKTGERSVLEYSGLLHYERCYMVPEMNFQLQKSFIERQGYWLVDSESEAIEFDGCDYGECELLQGRFYHQTDLVTSGIDAIVPKSPEFAKWAERVFRRARRSLIWSPELDACIGDKANKWKDKGGRFLDAAATIRTRATRVRLQTTRIQ